MDDNGLETRRLRLLVELSRLGSTRAVAGESHITRTAPATQALSWS